MAKSLSDKDRSRVVSMAEDATAKECRRLNVKCWKKTADGEEYTPYAQQLFEQFYDHFEGVILAFRRR